MNITYLSLKLIGQSYTQEKVTNLLKGLMWIINIECPVKKSHTKTTQDIVKYLCASLLYIEINFAE